MTSLGTARQSNESDNHYYIREDQPKTTEIDKHIVVTPLVLVGYSDTNATYEFTQEDNINMMANDNSVLDEWKEHLDEYSQHNSGPTTLDTVENTGDIVRQWNEHLSNYLQTRTSPDAIEKMVSDYSMTKGWNERDTKLLQSRPGPTTLVVAEGEGSVIAEWIEHLHTHRSFIPSHSASNSISLGDYEVKSQGNPIQSRPGPTTLVVAEGEGSVITEWIEHLHTYRSFIPSHSASNSISLGYYEVKSQGNPIQSTMKPAEGQSGNVGDNFQGGANDYTLTTRDHYIDNGSIKTINDAKDISTRNLRIHKPNNNVTYMRFGTNNARPRENWDTRLEQPTPDPVQLSEFDNTRISISKTTESEKGIAKFKLICLLDMVRNQNAKVLGCRHYRWLRLEQDLNPLTLQHSREPAPTVFEVGTAIQHALDHYRADMYQLQCLVADQSRFWGGEGENSPTHEINTTQQQKLLSAIERLVGIENETNRSINIQDWARQNLGIVYDRRPELVHALCEVHSSLVRFQNTPDQSRFQYLGPLFSGICTFHNTINTGECLWINEFINASVTTLGCYII